MPNKASDSPLDVLSTLDTPAKDSPVKDAPQFDPAKSHLPKDLKDTAIQHDRQLIQARYSPDGNFIISAGLDKLIHVWEIATKRHYTLPGHDTWISSLVLNPKTGIAYAADFHGNIRAWDWKKENSKPLFNIVADKNITRSLAVTADGKQIVSGGDDAIVRVWDAASGSKVHDLSGHQGCIFSVACHPDGKHIVSGDLFGSIRQWDGATGKQVREFDAKRLHSREEDALADVGGVRCFAFNAEGSLMAAGGYCDVEGSTFCPGTPLVLVFDWSTGKKKNELTMSLKKHGPIDALIFLKDGTLVGYGELMNAATELVFWKPDKAEPFHKVTAQTGYDLDLHPDGLHLLAPTHKAMGSGGNGARSKHKEDYFSNSTQFLVFNLYEDLTPKAKNPQKGNNPNAKKKV